jgi:hypothetical protein
MVHLEFLTREDEGMKKTLLNSSAQYTVRVCLGRSTTSNNTIIAIAPRQNVNVVWLADVSGVWSWWPLTSNAV